MVYFGIFILVYGFVFLFGWLRSATRQVSNPNLAVESLPEIAVISALAAAYAVFKFVRSRG